MNSRWTRQLLPLVFPPAVSLSFFCEAVMRRPLLLLALVVSSIAIAACTSVTAPTSRQDDCKSGYISSDGRFICTDPG
jgi:hypothetical protein